MAACRKALAVLALLVPMIAIAGSAAVEPVGGPQNIASTLSGTSRAPGAHQPRLLASLELPQPADWATWLSAVIAVAFVVRRKSIWQ